MAKKISLVLVDDSRLVREGLTALLGSVRVRRPKLDRRCPVTYFEQPKSSDPVTRKRRRGPMSLTIKRLAVALCLAVVLPIPGFGQSDPTLKKAVDARQAAQWAGNAEEWGKYTTDDFLVTGADGVVKTKQQRMTEIAGHPITTPAPSPTDDKWRQYGTTAIRTSSVVINGKPTRLTTVWVKQQGVWKVAAVQLTNIAQP
jgi:Domain of unknown function (DUF4440)